MAAICTLGCFGIQNCLYLSGTRWEITKNGTGKKYQSSSKNTRTSTPFVVMWTSTREDMTSENWIPNIFVPLLQPIEIPDFLDSSADDVVDQGCGPVFNNTMIKFDDDDHENLLEISGLSAILNSLQEKEVK